MNRWTMLSDRETENETKMGGKPERRTGGARGPAW